MSVIICIVCSFVVCVICLAVPCRTPDSACFLFASHLPIYLVRCASLPGCLLSSLRNGFISLFSFSATIKGSQTIYLYLQVTNVLRGLKTHHSTVQGQEKMRLQGSHYWTGGILGEQRMYAHLGPHYRHFLSLKSYLNSD